MTWIFADGCRLPFPDKSFDVVFSNSVIEHLGDPRKHEQYAREIARVGVRYFVQTPNRWFPIEPHLLTPLVHFLPRDVAAAVDRAIHGVGVGRAAPARSAGVLLATLSKGHSASGWYVPCGGCSRMPGWCGSGSLG